LTFIFIKVVLDALALAMTIPALPSRVAELVNRDMARAAAIYGLFGTMSALMQLSFSPVLGAISDRYGRRRVMLLSNLGRTLDYGLMALAPSLGWLVVGRVISGIASASSTADLAYVADVTPDEERSSGFGFVSVASGLGFVLGPLAGGLLAPIGPRLPFCAAAVISLLNVLYGLLVLPESLPREHRSTSLSLGRARAVGSLSFLLSGRALLGLAAVSFLARLAHEALPSTFALYAMHRYGWGGRQVGLTLACVGVLTVLVQGAVVPIVIRFGDRRVLVAGTLSGAAAMATLGLATTGSTLGVFVPLVALWGISGPAAQSLMTRLVGPREQGHLQGANGSIVAVARLVGPGLFSMTLASSVQSGGDFQLHGAVFLLAALLLLVAATVAWHVTRERGSLRRPASA
jgi:DHA1 family tetracycline resistance protein-like MFS transporter